MRRVVGTKSALESIGRKRLFPAGLPETSLKTKLYSLLILVGSAAFVIVTLVDLTANSFNGTAFGVTWLLKSETLFATITSLVLFRAHKSWVSEDYHALRDQLGITFLTAASMLGVQSVVVFELLTNLQAGMLIDVIGFRFLLIESGLMAGMIAFAGMVLYLLRRFAFSTSSVDGYILSLRPRVQFTLQLTALVWIGLVALRLFVNSIL